MKKSKIKPLQINGLLCLTPLDNADYTLLEADGAYAPFVVGLKEKANLSKMLISFLEQNPAAQYGDLVSMLDSTVPNELDEAFSEDTLLHHAEWLATQVSFSHVQAMCTVLAALKFLHSTID